MASPPSPAAPEIPEDPTPAETGDELGQDEPAPAGPSRVRKRPPDLLQPLRPDLFRPSEPQPHGAVTPMSAQSASSAVSAQSDLPPPTPTPYQELVEVTDAQAVVSDKYGPEGVRLTTLEDDLWPPDVLLRLKRAQDTDKIIMDRIMDIPRPKLSHPERVREYVRASYEELKAMTDDLPPDKKEAVRELFEKMGTDLTEKYRSAAHEADAARQSSLQNLNEAMEDLEVSAERTAIIKLEQRVRADVAKEVLEEMRRLQQKAGESDAALKRQESECKRLMKENIGLTNEIMAFKKLVEALKAARAKDKDRDADLPRREGDPESSAADIRQLQKRLEESYNQMAMLQGRLLDAEEQLTGVPPLPDTDPGGEPESKAAGASAKAEEERADKLVTDVVKAISEHAFANKDIVLLGKEQEQTVQLIDKATGEIEQLSSGETGGDSPGRKSAADLIREKEEAIDQLRAQLKELQTENDKLEEVRREKYLRMLEKELEVLRYLISNQARETPPGEVPPPELKNEETLDQTWVGVVREQTGFLAELANDLIGEPPHGEPGGQQEHPGVVDKDKAAEIMEQKRERLVQLINATAGEAAAEAVGEDTPRGTLKEKSQRLFKREDEWLDRLADRVAGEPKRRDSLFRDAERLREKEVLIRAMRRELLGLDFKNQLLTEKSQRADKELQGLREKYKDLQADPEYKKLHGEREALRKRIAELEAEIVEDKLRSTRGLVRIFVNWMRPRIGGADAAQVEEEGGGEQTKAAAPEKDAPQAQSPEKADEDASESVMEGTNPDETKPGEEEPGKPPTEEEAKHGEQEEQHEKKDEPEKDHSEGAPKEASGPEADRPSVLKSFLLRYLTPSKKGPKAQSTSEARPAPTPGTPSAPELDAVHHIPLPVYSAHDYRGTCQNCVPILEEDTGPECTCCHPSPPDPPKTSPDGATTATTMTDVKTEPLGEEGENAEPKAGDDEKVERDEKVEQVEKDERLERAEKDEKATEKPAEHRCQCIHRRGTSDPSTPETLPIVAFACPDHRLVALRRDAPGVLRQLATFTLDLLARDPLAAFHAAFLWALLVFAYALRTLAYELRRLQHWRARRGRPQPPRPAPQSRGAGPRPPIPALPRAALTRLLAYGFLAVTWLAYIAAREERRLWLRANGLTADYLRDLRVYYPYPWWSPVQVDYRFVKPWLTGAAGRVLLQGRRDY